jgi:DnaK suppressor protein
MRQQASCTEGGENAVLSSSKIEYFERALMKLRRRVLKEIDFEEETIGIEQRVATGTVYGIHMMAEHATDAETREVAACLVTVDGGVLRDIDDALRKLIQKKGYGICEYCGNRISERRLRALPYARLCKKCQFARERP